MAGPVIEELRARALPRGYPRARAVERLAPPRAYSMRALREYGRKAQAEHVTGPWTFDDEIVKKPLYDVRAYGARGIGDTFDDGPALQAAMEAAQADGSGAGRAFCPTPPNYYFVDQAGDAGYPYALKILDGGGIIGTGWGCEIRGKGNYAIFKTDDAWVDTFRIEGFKLTYEGTHSNPTWSKANAIWFKNQSNKYPNNFTIQDVWIYDAYSGFLDESNAWGGLLINVITQGCRYGFRKTGTGTTYTFIVCYAKGTRGEHYAGEHWDIAGWSMEGKIVGATYISCAMGDYHGDKIFYFKDQVGFFINGFDYENNRVVNPGVAAAMLSFEKDAHDLIGTIQGFGGNNNELGGPVYTAATISFDSATKEIRDSADGLAGGFKDGDTIVVAGSVDNDGTYTVASGGGGHDGKIEVEEALTDEAAGASVTISTDTADNAGLMYVKGGLVSIDNPLLGPDVTSRRVGDIYTLKSDGAGISARAGRIKDIAGSGTPKGIVLGDAGAEITLDRIDYDTLTNPNNRPVFDTGAGAAAGEGHILLMGPSYDSVGAGSPGISIAVGGFCNGYLEQGANGDNISFKAYLDAGTYTLFLLGRTLSAFGIMDIDIDAVEVASFDQYSAGLVENVRFTDTGNVVATSGLKTIRLRNDGKNGSSSGFKTQFVYLALWRTA